MNILKAKRKSMGLRLCEISDKLGVSEMTISRYENDIRFPHPTELLAVARAYQLTDQEILDYLSYIESRKDKK